MAEQDENPEYEPPYDMLSEDVFDHLVAKGVEGLTDKEFAWMVKSREHFFQRKQKTEDVGAPW